MKPDLWKDKRVLITGHTGFKGAWLTLMLHRFGAKVCGYALPAPTHPSLFEAAGVASLAGVTHRAGDVRDLGAVSTAVAAFAPEVVFHLAAQSLVREGYRDPVGTLATNVMGTTNVLEACRGAGSVRGVVNVTTDKCYENRDLGRPFVETDPMGGFDPYSASKGCSELVTAAYRRSFFAEGRIRLASARAGNVIGPGDFAADRIIPDCIRALSAGQPVRVRNPNATRPWQLVLEPLAGYLTLAEALLGPGGEAFADGFNFGPDLEDAQPVSVIATAITSRWGGGASWVPDPGPHPHEARLLTLDTSRARSALGWQPKIRLTKALEWTVDGYRAIMAGQHVREECFKQINRYLSL